MAGKNLTLKQQRFVMEYQVDCNATQAAIRAGYHPKMAAKLVAKSSILDAIEKEQAKMAEKLGIKQADNVEYLRRVRDSKLPDVVNWDGKDLTVRSFDELTEDQKNLIESIEQVDTKDGRRLKVHFARVADKVRAVAEMNKMLGFHAERDTSEPEVVLNLQIMVPEPSYATHPTEAELVEMGLIEGPKS